MCYEFISIPHIKEKFGTVWYGTVRYGKGLFLSSAKIGKNLQM